MKVVRLVSCRAVLILSLLVIILHAPIFMAAGLTNMAQILISRGMIAQTQAQLEPERAVDLLQAFTAKAALEPAHSMLGTAIRLDPHNLSARRVLYLEALITRNQAGDYASVIRLYETASPDVSQVNRRANDIIALAYLERAKSLLAIGDNTSARSVLETIMMLRPGDLYALYQLLELDTRMGNSQKADLWRDQLIHFSDRALYFPDAHLADFAADAIYQFVSEGIWERSVALNSAALLAWQESGSPGTERLLRRLATYYLTEPEWHYLLGEVSQRQGRWADAYAEYQHALAADPTYDLAWLRLGTTCEALVHIQQPKCTQHIAREFYMVYMSTHPDDTVALTKLLGIERELGLTTVKLEAKLHSLLDERLILAEQLNLAPDVIALGPNLITHPGFELLSGSHPTGWHESSLANNPPFDRALFRTGLDSLDSAQGNQSARVSGLWVGNQLGHARPRAGFWVWDDSLHELHLIPLKREAIYMLSFNYRTLWTGERGVTVYLNAGAPLDGSFGGEHYFPPTGGAWRRALLLGWTGDDSPGVLPLLRSWSPGQVWFDNVQLKQVMISSRSAQTLIPGLIVVIR